MIARALAQQTPVLVLDEPTNHLDILNQLALLDLMRKLQVTTIAAMHDLNLAATYADRLHVLEAGWMVASGPPEQVLTPEPLAAVFGVHAEFCRHPRTGQLVILMSSLDGLEP